MRRDSRPDDHGLWGSAVNSINILSFRNVLKPWTQERKLSQNKDENGGNITHNTTHITNPSRNSPWWLVARKSKNTIQSQFANCICNWFRQMQKNAFKKRCVLEWYANDLIYISTSKQNIDFFRDIVESNKSFRRMMERNHNVASNDVMCDEGWSGRRKNPITTKVRCQVSDTMSCRQGTVLRHVGEQVSTGVLRKTRIGFGYVITSVVMRR